MTSDKPLVASPSDRLRPLRPALLALVAAGAGALYLTTANFEIVPAMGCGGDAQCAALFSGRWSRWLGIPASLVALVVYAGALVTVLRSGSSGKPRKAAAVAGAITLASAVWFAIAQVLLADHWCLPCFITHVCGAIAGALLLTEVKASAARRAGALAGGAAAVALIAGQLVAAPKPSAAKPERAVAGPPSAEPVATATASASASVDAGPEEPVARLIGLHIGRFVLNGNDQPFWGRAGSGLYPGIALFDYTDENTRKMKPVFEEAIARYKGAFVILLLPAPLDASCNPFVNKTLPENQHACEYVRLAYAIWRADREEFRRFDNFMFAKARPPSLQKARAKAEELVGKEALEKALADPWVEKQIKMGPEVMKANEEKGIEWRLPQLMLGAVMQSGPAKLEELTPTLDEFTQLVPPRLPQAKPQ